MEYEEIKKRYDNMTYLEFGKACKDRFDAEHSIIKDLEKVAPALSDAAITVLVEHYNAMELYFRLANFLLRVYIEADKKGVALDQDCYAEHLQHYFKDVVGEKPIKELIADFEKEKGEGHYIEISSCFDASKQKRIGKFKKYFPDFGSDETMLMVTNQSLFGFSKGFIATDEKLYVRINNTFTVRYEDVADIYFKISSDGKTCDFFAPSAVKSYCQKDPDTFKNTYWSLWIMYYDEDGELRDEKLTSYGVSGAEAYGYYYDLISNIRWGTFYKNYEKYLATKKSQN